MTEVEAAVRQLGKAIQADPRYQAYWKAKTDNDADTELQENIQAFKLKSWRKNEIRKNWKNWNRRYRHFICRSWKTRTCRLLILPSRQ